jgi:thiol-disulfide isomerase/thioredoxin
VIIQKIDIGRVIAGLLVVMALLAVIETDDQSRFAAPTSAPTMVAVTPPSALTFIPPTIVPTARATPELAPYPIYGPAAEIRNEVWLNTDTPLRLTDLRGQVVLLSFWAFDCTPCMPVLSTVRGWYDTYGGQGLTIIGVHYPRIEAERDFDNLVEALIRLDVPYPVVQDNDGLTWNAYGQRVLPTLYLIDRRGFLRYRFVGMGGSDETETAIRALLGETS